MKLCADPKLNSKANELVRFTIKELHNHSLDEKILSLILTGSFARGEGSIITLDNRIVVLGDIEIMVVFHAKAQLTKLYLVLKQLANDISVKLKNNNIICEIDFAPITSEYFLKAKPTIFNIELKEHGQILFGDYNYLNCIPAFSTSDIPQQDAFNLLSNRIIEQLILYERLHFNNIDNFAIAKYQITKLMLDVGGSFLAFIGEYKTTYTDRLKSLEKLSLDGYQKLGIDGLFLKYMREATENKIYPNAEIFFPNKINDLYSMKKILVTDFIDAIPTVKKIWLWEFNEYFSFFQSTKNMEYLKNIYTFKTNEKFFLKYKYWLKMILVHIKYKKPFQFRKIFRLINKGSPRHLINLCSASTYFLLLNINNINYSSTEVLPIRDMIPVHYFPYETEYSPEEIFICNLKNIIYNWKFYIKDF